MKNVTFCLKKNKEKKNVVLKSRLGFYTCCRCDNYVHKWCNLCISVFSLSDGNEGRFTDSFTKKALKGNGIEHSFEYFPSKTFEYIQGETHRHRLLYLFFHPLVSPFSLLFSTPLLTEEDRSHFISPQAVTHLLLKHTRTHTNTDDGCSSGTLGRPERVDLLAGCF